MGKLKARHGITWFTAPAEFEADGDGVLIVQRSGGTLHVGRMTWEQFERSAIAGQRVMDQRDAARR